MKNNMTAETAVLVHELGRYGLDVDSASEVVFQSISDADVEVLVIQEHRSLRTDFWNKR